MSDDYDALLEQSAAQAMRAAQSATLDKSQRDISETGLQTRNINDGVMNDGRKYDGGIGTAPEDVRLREAQENRRSLQLSQAIEEIGGLDLNDLCSIGLADKDPVAVESAKSLMRMQHAVGHVVQQGAANMINDAYMNPNADTMMMEQAAYQPMVQDGWGVVKKTATLRNGKRVPVFVVEDSLSGMTTGKRYRIASVAEKIAKVITATQNPDDPRVGMIDRLYDRHVKLMQEKTRAKRAGNANKVTICEAKLSEVNAKLGLD